MATIEPHPAPVLASLTDFWLIRLVYKGGMFEGLGSVCKKYGMSFLLLLDDSPHQD